MLSLELFVIVLFSVTASTAEELIDILWYFFLFCDFVSFVTAVDERSFVQDVWETVLTTKKFINSFCRFRDNLMTWLSSELSRYVSSVLQSLYLLKSLSLLKSLLSSRFFIFWKVSDLKKISIQTFLCFARRRFMNRRFVFWRFSELTDFQNFDFAFIVKNLLFVMLSSLFMFTSINCSVESCQKRGREINERNTRSNLLWLFADSDNFTKLFEKQSEKFIKLSDWQEIFDSNSFNVLFSSEKEEMTFFWNDNRSIFWESLSLETILQNLSSDLVEFESKLNFQSTNCSQVFLQLNESSTLNQIDTGSRWAKRFDIIVLNEIQIAYVNHFYNVVTL